MPIATAARGGVHRLDCAGSCRASVILLHGYAASAAVNVEDGRAFVDDHTDVVVVDAPGHGARRDGTLERLAAMADEARTEAIVGLAAQWALELPSVAAACRQRGAERVGLVGISMGGLAAFAALADPSTFDAVAAVLAWPGTIDVARTTPGEPPLLIGIAGRDAAVPPEPSRRFAAAYGAELHEYPESEHHMRADDWHDLWGATVAFLRRHLATPAPQRDA